MENNKMNLEDEKKKSIFVSLYDITKEIGKYTDRVIKNMEEIEEYVEDKNEFKEFWNRMALDSGKMICDIEKIKRKIILEEN